MYDTVKVPCPYCEHVIQLQTQTGPCKQNMYSFTRVPLALAVELVGATCVCANCGLSITLHVPFDENHVQMFITSI